MYKVINRKNGSEVIKGDTLETPAGKVYTFERICANQIGPYKGFIIVTMEGRHSTVEEASMFNCAIVKEVTP